MRDKQKRSIQHIQCNKSHIINQCLINVYTKTVNVKLSANYQLMKNIYMLQF